MAYRMTIILSCLLAAALPPVQGHEASSRAYTFGVVPQFDQRHIFSVWRPILDRVEAATGMRFELTGSRCIPDFENRFMRGDFDFAYMNPYHMLMANEAQGYTPLVRDVGKKLQGIIVVRRDSPIHSVTELDGGEIAFPAPNALGASLLPRALFARKFHIRITPRYVQTHDSVYLHVYKGLVSAGGGVQKTLQEQPRAIREALRVLYTTPPMAPHPIAAHPRVPVAVRERVARAFLALGRNADGTALLAKVPVKRIGPASLNDYLPLSRWELEAFLVRSEAP